MGQKAWIGLATFLVCAGCAGVDVTHVASNGDFAPVDNSPVAKLTGVPWNLAMTQYQLTITRQVSKCDGTLDGSVTVAVTTAKAADPKQKYVLDGSGWWATSDITSTLALDATSTGLSTTSQNAAAQIIQNVVGLVAGAADLSKETFALETVTKTPPATFACKAAVTAALKDMNTPTRGALTKKVTDDTAAASKATAAVTTLTAEAAQDPSYKKALAKALDDMRKANNTQAADQDRLNKDLKAVQIVQTVSWPMTADDFHTDNAFVLDDQDVNKHWLDWTPAGQTGTLSLAQKSPFQVTLAIYYHADDGFWRQPPPGQKTAVGDVSIGIPVRVGRIGRLLICTGIEETCNGPLKPDWQPSKTATNSGNNQVVLQLGQMYNIRVRSTFLKSEKAVITLDPASGEPTQIEVSEQQAAAAALSGAISSAATTLAAVPGQITAYQQAQALLQETQGQALSAQVASRTAQINLNASLPTLAATDTAAAQQAFANGQIALASAQANAQNAGPAATIAATTAMLTAQNSLAAQEASEPNSNEIDALNAQTALNNATAAQINSAVAVTNAQAALK
jgi:hypothetical protein